MSEVIITFRNVRLVIKADKLLQQHQLICKIVPVPEHISSECGMCIATNDENSQDIKQILNTHGIEYSVNW
jgi:hypothetical protein